jgi:hypothetical protein
MQGRATEAALPILHHTDGCPEGQCRPKGTPRGAECVAWPGRRRALVFRLSSLGIERWAVSDFTRFIAAAGLRSRTSTSTTPRVRQRPLCPSLRTNTRTPRPSRPLAHIDGPACITVLVLERQLPDVLVACLVTAMSLPKHKCHGPAAILMSGRSSLTSPASVYYGTPVPAHIELVDIYNSAGEPVLTGYTPVPDMPLPGNMYQVHIYAAQLVLGRCFLPSVHEMKISHAAGDHCIRPGICAGLVRGFVARTPAIRHRWAASHGQRCVHGRPSLCDHG